MDGPQLIAGLCCFGMWTPLAAGAWWGAEVRMKRAEAALGRRALPDEESAWLWYAGAAAMWLSAGVLALVGLGSKSRARLGRGCTRVLLGHMTLVVLVAVLAAPPEQGPKNLTGLVAGACAVAALGMVAALVCVGHWSQLRAARLSADASELRPGLERFALYLLCALIWPAGLVALFVWSKPGNAREGSVAFRWSLANVGAIALATCVALPLIVAHMSAHPELLTTRRGGIFAVVAKDPGSVGATETSPSANVECTPRVA